MPPVLQDTLAPFATLPVAAPRGARWRWRFSQLFLAPFHDLDDRAVPLALASRPQRASYRPAMSGADEPSRR